MNHLREELIILLQPDFPAREPRDGEATYGECRLVPMTAAGERGIACQMQIEPHDLPWPRRYPGGKAAAMRTALKPLLEDPPRPVFFLPWDEEARLWCSRFFVTEEVPSEIGEVFERTGIGLHQTLTRWCRCEHSRVWSRKR